MTDDFKELPQHYLTPKGDAMTQLRTFYFSEFRLIRELPDGTRFLRIPKILQQPISASDNGVRCSCDYCNANPKQTPSWDTLAVPSVGANDDGHCWTVHHPEESKDGK